MIFDNHFRFVSVLSALKRVLIKVSRLVQYYRRFDFQKKAALEIEAS